MFIMDTLSFQFHPGAKKKKVFHPRTNRVAFYLVFIVDSKILLVEVNIKVSHYNGEVVLTKVLSLEYCVY